MDVNHLLRREFLDNPLRDWMIALGVFIAVVLALYLVRRLLVGRLERLSASTSNEIDDVVVDMLRRTKFFAILLVALFVGAQSVTLRPRAVELMRDVAMLALLLQAGIWGNGLITFGVARWAARRAEANGATRMTLGIATFLSRVFLWSLIFLMALDNLGFDITTLLAGLGVGGIAVALAVQSILGDLFGALSIVLDRPFVVGDFIVVDQFMGEVEHTGLKTTRLRSLSGEQIIFSNADLLKARIRNFKRMFERRVVINLGVVYGTAPEVLERIPGMVREAIEAQELARFDRSHFKGLGPSSLDFEAVYYLKSPDYAVHMDVQQAIYLSLYRRFLAEDIEFAFPTQTIHVIPDPPQERPAREPVRG